MLLEDFSNAKRSLDSCAGDKAIVIFFSEGGLGHLTVRNRRRLLAAQKHWLNARRAVAGSLQRCPDVAHEQRNLRHQPHDAAVPENITVLEDGVIGSAV